MPENEKFLLSLTLGVVSGILLGLFSFLWVANCQARGTCDTISALLPPRTQPTATRPAPTTATVTAAVAIEQLTQTPIASATSVPPTPLQPTASPTASPTATATASPTVTSSPTRKLTPTPTATRRLTRTPTPTPSPSPTLIPKLTLEELVEISAESDWMIIAGGYPYFANAERDVERFAEEGYHLVILWQQGEWRSAILGYDSQESAETVLEIIQDTIRSTAYVRQTSRWCPNMSVRDNYIQCGTG